MRTKALLSVFIGTVLLLSFGIGLKDAQADALLFPWVIKSATISTIVSVVNTAQTDAEALGLQNHDNKIHIEYWYKETSANYSTERCNEYDFIYSTSMFDLVSFDVSGILNSGLPMFYDDYSLTIPIMALPVENPRRAFLIVDNNTPALVAAGTNLEGTLYGEALFIEHVTGQVFGYIAYNAKPGGVTAGSSEPLYFSNGKDRHGEVIGSGEFGRLVFFPPQEYNTRIFVTPIMPDPATTVGPGQRVGNANVAIQLCAVPEVGVDGYPTGNCVLSGFFLNNEVPISDIRLKNIACTSAESLEALMGAAAWVSLVASGTAGWTHILTHTGYLGSNLYQETDQAVVGKLIWKEDSHQISFDKECLSCKSQWKICNKKCQETCDPICNLPSQTITNGMSDFQWIRGDDSMPYVYADGIF